MWVNSAVETAPANGAVVINTDGSYTYTPTASYSGEDSFVFRDTDTVTGLSSIATAKIGVGVVVQQTVDQGVLSSDAVAWDGGAGWAANDNEEALPVAWSEAI